MGSLNIKLNRNADEPLHLQLSEALQRYILNSSVNTTFLPSERSLCDNLKLNRSTVHRAYEALVQKGVVRPGTNKKLEIAPDARRLLAGAFPAIGLLLPEKFSTYVSNSNASSLPYLKGIFDRAAEQNCSVFMLQIPPPETSESEMESFMESNLDKLIGIIHLGARDCASDRPLDMVFQCDHLPQIAISGTSEFCHIGSVRTDFTGAAKELAARLKEKKCRTFGILDSACFRHRTFTYAVAERSRIMKKILTDSGLQLLPQWHIEADLPENAGKFLAAAYTKNIQLPDFLWCINDHTALQAVEFFSARGIKIPDDLKIAGFDGINTPRDLTTIGQNFYQLGADAVDLLLEHFEKGISKANRNKTVKAFFVSGTTI